MDDGPTRQEKMFGFVQWWCLQAAALQAGVSGFSLLNNRPCMLELKLNFHCHIAGQYCLDSLRLM